MKSPYRTRTVVIGLGLAVPLVVAAPVAAFAHVHVGPEEVVAGESTTLTFSTSHGCDGSPTTAIQIMLPEQVVSVTPVAKAGWEITTGHSESAETADHDHEAETSGHADVPGAVTFTAGQPLADGIQDSFSLKVTASAESAGSKLAFPVLQECAEGSTSWDQTAEDGADPESLERPAPVVSVIAAESETAGSEVVSNPDSAGDLVARILSIAALCLAGITLIILVLTRTRRHESSGDGA